VDGTLLMWPTKAGAPRPGETPTVSTRLADELRRWQKESGGQLVIWTKGGTAHAEMAARLAGIKGAICIAKPDCFIDDASPEKLMRRFSYCSPSSFPRTQ
jgi:hypothetical protein